MVGRSRVSGIERVLAPGAVACLVLGVGGCFAYSGQPQPLPDSSGAAGAAGSSVPGGSAGSSVPGGSAGGAVGAGGALVPMVAAPCIAPPVIGSALFSEQIFDNTRVARREFFSWTTDEQVAELRQDQVLFSRSERPGMGPGFAFEILEQIAQDETQPERAQLARLFGGELFAKARYAWSEPWATRMGWPGEDYGGNLLRIVLKPEAWVVVLRKGDLTVIDLQNQLVPLPQALANPAQIGAVFHEKDAFEGGPSCGGSFTSGSNGYREFILGNPAMVEEWSLGTQSIRDRLSADIDRLSSFLERIRVCPVTQSAQQWNLAVVCAWAALRPVGPLGDGRPESPFPELAAYEQSLAIPSDNYLAVPDRIATMIETLHGDLFEPNPLVVTTGKP